MSSNSRGIFLFRDELIGLFNTFEKPGHESDRSFYLETWPGTQSYDNDTIGRGNTNANLCLSLFGGIQPDKLRKFISRTLKDDNDGFVQRLQCMVYPSEGNWNYVDESPDTEAADLGWKVIEFLAQTDFASCGAEVDEKGRHFYRFSDEAQTRFAEWITQLETHKLKNADDTSILRQHLSKYRSLMPSLALIFHLTEVAASQVSDFRYDCESVGIEATEKAIAWCEYLEGHARKVYGLIGDQKHNTLQALASKIQTGKLNDCFTVRDVYRNDWTYLDDQSHIQTACDELVELDWLKLDDTSTTTTKYLVNPYLHNDSGQKV